MQSCMSWWSPLRRSRPITLSVLFNNGCLRSFLAQKGLVPVLLDCVNENKKVVSGMGKRKLIYSQLAWLKFLVHHLDGCSKLAHVKDLKKIILFTLLTE